MHNAFNSKHCHKAAQKWLHHNMKPEKETVLGRQILYTTLSIFSSTAPSQANVWKISIQILSSAMIFCFCQHNFQTAPFCICTGPGFLKDIDSCASNQHLFDTRQSRFVDFLDHQHASASYYYWCTPCLLKCRLLIWESVRCIVMQYL